MASQSKRRRVRYDRILAVLLVLILLIVLLVKCCSSCSSNKDKKNDNVTTTPTQATTAPTEADNTKTVYLSPSNQEDNKFYVGDTNEAAVCRILAQKTAAILEQSGVNVIVAGDADSIQTKTAAGEQNLAALLGLTGKKHQHTGKAGGDVRGVEVRIAVKTGQARDRQVGLHNNIPGDVRIVRDQPGKDSGGKNAAGKEHGCASERGRPGTGAGNAREQQEHEYEHQVVVRDGAGLQDFGGQRQRHERCRQNDLPDCQPHAVLRQGEGTADQ